VSQKVAIPSHFARNSIRPFGSSGPTYLSQRKAGPSAPRSSHPHGKVPLVLQVFPGHGSKQLEGPAFGLSVRPYPFSRGGTLSE
jgi:hypothetical protein